MFGKHKVTHLKFEIGGRAVTRANWHRFGPDVTEDKLDAIVRPVYEALADMSCATHGGEPEILCRGPSLDQCHFMVTACCDNFKKKVEDKLDAVRPSG